MRHELRRCDVGIGLGSHDLGVAVVATASFGSVCSGGVASIGDARKVIDMLVGDTQRVEVYAERGFAIPQEVPDDVRAAFERLVAAGFTSRLV